MDQKPLHVPEPEDTTPKETETKISPVTIPAIRIANIEDHSINESRYDNNNNSFDSKHSYSYNTIGNCEKYRSLSDRLSSLLQIPRTNESYCSSLPDNSKSNEVKLNPDKVLLRHSVSQFSLNNPSLSSSLDSSGNELAILKSKSMNSIPDSSAIRRRRKYSEIVSSQRLIPTS